MNVFKAYIDDKGITGMTEKFGETFQGRLGALGDQLQQTFASLGGIDANGNVEKGGLFDIAGRNLEKLMNALERFGKSQAFDKLKNQIESLGTGIEKGIDYISSHPEVIDRLLSLGKAFVGLKVVTTIISPFIKLGNSLSKLPSIIKKVLDVTDKTKTDTAKNVGEKLVDSISKSNKTKNIGNTLSNAGKVVAGTALVAGATSSLYKTDGFIHKLGNNLNPINWFAKDGEKEDYLAQIFGTSSKATIWGMNKLNLISDKQANMGYANADKYVQNANDYINGKTDKVLNLRDMNANANANQTVNVNIGTIEKEVDADTVIMKIANIFNKNKARNAVVY